jgi:hypothetical protein
MNRIAIRKAIIVSDSELTEENLWQKEVPYDTRQLAIDQILAAYKSCFALKNKGYIEQFDVKFKSKKQ